MIPDLSNTGVPESATAELVSLYQDAAGRLKQIVLNPPGRTEKARQFAASRAAQQIAQIDGLLVSLNHGTAAWIGSNLPKAMIDGITRGNQQAKDAGVLPDNSPIKGNFAQINHKTAEVFARDIYGDLSKASDSMTTTAKVVLRQTRQQDLDEHEIDRILAGGVIEGKPDMAIRQLRDKLRSVTDGNVTVIDKNGQPIEFEAGYYASMVARTKTREANVHARHERLAELGMDLVAIDGRVSKNFCTAYLGLVFSISGKSSKYPSLSSLPSHGPPFHPNCSKSTKPYIDALATETETDNAEANPDQEKLLNVDATTAQKRFKDLQLHTQMKDKATDTAEKLYGPTKKAKPIAAPADLPAPAKATAATPPANTPPAKPESTGPADRAAQPPTRNAGSARGRDLGNPEEHREEESLRRQILGLPSYEEVQAARQAVERANELCRQVRAGDKSLTDEAKAAIAEAQAKKADLRVGKAATTAEAHAAIAVSDGANVTASASRALANSNIEGKTAHAFIAQVISKAAAPPDLRLNVLTAGEKLPSGKAFSGRAFASPYKGAKQMTVSPDVKAATVVHEFGHVIEAESAAHFQAAIDFLLRRTEGMELKPLAELTGNPKYGDTEKALDDHFRNPYVGKQYLADGPGSYKGYGASEVTAMGVERMMRDPVEFAKEDPDFFRFTLAQLRRKATPR